MAPETTCKKLAAAIRQLISCKMHIDRNVLHYIDSTLSDPSLVGIGNALRNENSDEREVLLALIFSPDETLQLKLESLIEAGNFSKKDQSRVLFLLSHPALKTKLIFADDRGALPLTVPPFALHQLIDRLKISKKIPAKLRNHLDHLNPHITAKVKVNIRNAGFDMTAKLIDFMGRFITADLLPPQKFISYFEYLLAFIEALPKDKDILEGAANRKKIALKMLHQAHDFERRLKRSNIETLMLQGVTAPCIDPQLIYREIVMLDYIKDLV